MKLSRRTVLAASAATLGSSLASGVKASPDWPTKAPVKLIATFPAGGTADTISRILAPKLSAALGTQVVVENKPGAGGTIVPHINSGKVRLLALSSEKRIEMYPNAPIFAEQGFPKMTTSTWVGVPGPKGLAPEVVSRLYDELQKAFKAPDVAERFKEVVLLPGDKPMSPAEYTKFVGDFAATWAEVSKSAGIQLELG